MLKALRVVSFLSAGISLAVMVLVLMMGLKGNPDIEIVLEDEGIIAQYKEKAQAAGAKNPQDAVSPLVNAAKAFALRIDPPPPPPPPPPPEKPKPKKTTPVRPPVRTKPTPTPKKQMNTRFSLIATVRYESNPEKSMVLMKGVSGPSEWYRQGDELGHLVIEEIKDRSVVLFQKGKYNSELFMPEPQKIRSLLKNDTDSVVTGPTSVSVSAGPGGKQTTVASTSPSTEGPKRTIPSRLSGRSTTRSSVPKRTIRTTPTRAIRTPPPPVETTPEEQKESIDKSIASIQEIMKQSSPKDGTDQKESNEAWNQLLNLLQEERKNIEKTEKIQIKSDPNS